MGHERSGVLPRTKRWREIVEHLASTDVSSDAVLDLATETLSNVRDRFDKIHQDRGVQAAFGFLVSLATQAEPAKHGITGVDTGVSESTSTLQLVRTLKQWVRENSDSLEYSSLAAKAATDAITGWANAQLEQPNLFASRGDIREVWDRASNGAGFCQVARMFFASFTEHYLNYFLDREASAKAG